MTTSSSTVGTGRRYRLRADLVEALNGELAEKLEPASLVGAVGMVRLAAGIENVVIQVPRSLTEPVGLDMAEPDAGVYVLVTYFDGSYDLAFRGGDRWTVTGSATVYTWEQLTSGTASITVLVPREEREAVELPLTTDGLDFEGRPSGLNVARAYSGPPTPPGMAAYLGINNGSTYLDAAQARAAGRALIAAADQYDATGPIGNRHSYQADSGE